MRVEEVTALLEKLIPNFVSLLLDEDLETFIVVKANKDDDDSEAVRMPYPDWFVKPDWRI